MSSTLGLCPADRRGRPAQTRPVPPRYGPARQTSKRPVRARWPHGPLPALS